MLGPVSCTTTDAMTESRKGPLDGRAAAKRNARWEQKTIDGSISLCHFRRRKCDRMFVRNLTIERIAHA